MTAVSSKSGLTAGLTLEQQAALSSGASFWSTKRFESVPEVYLTDGPHGLRKQDLSGGDHLGIGASVPATCFPPAVGMSQSWNPALIERVGQALGTECQAEGVHVLLGPGVNIKRDPRCGRNFEYYSEDPYLAGVLGTAWVNGVQSQGVGTSLKHFAANNAESDRMRSDSQIDMRTLREIYLRAFQRVVTRAQPWTVMCSYNKVNGVYSFENKWLLTDLLRGEWGFEGLVVSDWGAVGNRVSAVAAGLDLQMPAGDGSDDAALVAAAKSGAISEDDIHRAAERVAALADRASANAKPTTWAVEDHHALAREVAGQCIVLLTNDGVLPLAPDSSLAVIGEFATKPRYQGGGSSHVNATKVDQALSEIRAIAGNGVSYAAGFTTDGSGDAAALRAEAVAAASTAKAAVVFLGLADAQESEGFDRTDIELPPDQIDLLAAIAAVQPHTVVVLSHGGTLRLAPVVDHAAAILDGGLLGQAGGGAIADVLFGRVNPSGRLAETAPVRLEDVPSFGNFPGEHSRVTYGEGLLVGYRWYDARKLAVQFPFGHGLSYTTFAYSDLELAADDEGIQVRVRVTNTGSRAGREVVQAYVAVPDSAVVRPPAELKAFGSVELAPGASECLELRIERADLAYWDTRFDRWVVEGADYDVQVGASSRDIRVTGTVAFAGDEVHLHLDENSILSEVMADPTAGAILMQAVSATMGGGDASMGTDMMQMMGDFPIGRLASAFGAQIPADQVQALLTQANRANGYES